MQAFPSWNHVSKTTNYLLFFLAHVTKKYKCIQKWDDQCDEAFESLKKAVTSAPIFVSGLEETSWGHIDASQLAAESTLTQLDDEKRDRVISYFSKKLCVAEKDCLLFLEVKHSIAEKDYSDSYTSWIDSGDTCKEKPLKYLPSIKCWNTSSPIVS